MTRFGLGVAALAIALLSPASANAQSRYGDAGGHFFVFQELPGSTVETPNRCATHFGPLGGIVEAVREAALVAPVVDRHSALMDFEAARSAPVIGSISVCYRATTRDRDREALAIIEFEHEGQSLRIEAAGQCGDFSVPKTTTDLYQSCTLQVTGPKLEGIRSGSVASGGLVPQGAPERSVEPMTWSMFVVRD